ncbi:MAG: hypothetical protein ACI87H_001249 [Gammaproteobacteria bacterium]|jgi:hypothetical protein
MTEAVQLAKHYFDLSNAGNLAEIRKLFTPSSTYSSAHTGVYLGVDQIIQMQTDFFAGFETMTWKVHSVEEEKPGVVLFDFTFSGITLDGARVRRPGREYVIVFNDRIQHVEVRSND